MKTHITLFIISIALLSSHLSTAQCIHGNCSNGWGTYKWDSGDSYTGEWIGGARTGIGVYDWKDGTFYYGYFQDGKLEGDGFYIGLDSTADQVGVFHDGTLSYKKSFPTVGCVLGSCNDGDGIYLWETNDLYIGEWRAGNRTGYGRYDWDDGSWYVGSFTDGKLNGDGEYHPKDKDVMNGSFINGEFQGSTSSGSSSGSSSTPKKAATSYDYRSVTEADFCSVVKNVIADYSNDFENIKGALDEDDDWGNSWSAIWKLSGSKESLITEPLLGQHNTWYNVLYESTSFSEAQAKYNSYVTMMKNCGANCCTMVYDTHDYKGTSYESYLTYWLTLTVKDGYSDDYKNMQIEIELSQQILDNGWEVIARVKEFSD